MPRLLRLVASSSLRRQTLALIVLLLALLVVAACSVPAWAGYGSGYGSSSGSGIWALAWWAGNPEGPGPFTGPPADAAGECIWHDVGGSLSDLGAALSEASLPESFWTVPLSGGHPGIWGVLNWATKIVAKESAADHFDLVACPSPGQVPGNGGDVESDMPAAAPPGGGPPYLWIFWDTVADPPSGALPPVVEEAFQRTDLPQPVLSTSPSKIDGVARATVVNLSTWLWIGKSIWRTYSATAAAGPVVATVWAYPVSVSWAAAWDFPSAADDPEGGVSLAPEELDTTCAGPGLAYSSADSSEVADACTAAFDEPTFGTWQTLRATVSWVVHWAVSDPAGVVGGEGLLSDTSTSATTQLRVMQVESIISSG